MYELLCFSVRLRWGGFGMGSDLEGKIRPVGGGGRLYLSGDVWGVFEVIQFPQHFCREFPGMTNVFRHDLHLLSCRLFGVRPLLSGSKSSLIGHQHLDLSLHLWQA